MLWQCIWNDWRQLSLSRSLPSNIFTLFMKYFISSMANAKYKSQGEALCLSSWSCGMPVSALQSLLFGKAGCLFTRRAAFDASILRFFSELKKRERDGGSEEGKKKNLNPSSFKKRETTNKKRQFDSSVREIRFLSEVYLRYKKATA